MRFKWLQVEVIFSLFLEFKLGLHVEVGDLWPHFRIRVTGFWKPGSPLYSSTFTAVEQPKDTSTAVVDSFLSFAY